MKLIFATNNNNKLQEIRHILNHKYELLSLKDIGFHDDIEETESTIKGNSELKADFIFNKYKINCFADDTGLEIEALNGEPGVYSARYAGDNHDSQANMQKVLSKLEGIENRNAKFITVITLIYDNKKYFFEGVVNGTITTEKTGEHGFGYDPIFLPNGYSKTFAELSSELKNTISHRALAVKKLTDFFSIIN